MEAICKPDFDKREKTHNDADKAKKKAEKEGKSSKGIIVPGTGFYDIYGVWFFGRLKEIIMKIGIDRFAIDLTKAMHVFINVEPNKVADGIHEITVYDQKCLLYKWMAQGYHRGLVVLADDEEGNINAEAYRQSGTWSWILRVK